MDEVERFYDANSAAEWERLERHRTEFAVTMRVLRESLPPPPARVLDIGGGPGRYAIELARDGYDVSLVDLSAANLELAQSKAAAARVSISEYVHANALTLPAELADYDAALLLGPLYHLLTRGERVRALREADRVLRPGGVLFASFVTRFAPFRDAGAKYPEWVVEHRDDAERVLATGVQDRPTEFTYAYFAHPSEMRPLLEEAGFELLKTIGCEGVVAGHEHKVNELSGEAWDVWVDLNYRLGSDEALLGAADHVVCVARKGR